MGVRESLLNTITSVADSDFVRIVTSAGASSKATVKNLFKGFESNLGAKSSLDTSDYIRVVGSDNESYKNSIASLFNLINLNIGTVSANSQAAFEEGLLTKLNAMSDGEIKMIVAYPNYSGSFSGGARCPAALYRISSGLYKCEMLTSKSWEGYYYSNVWHWCSEIDAMSTKTLTKSYTVTVSANGYTLLEDYSSLGVAQNRIRGFLYTAGNYPIILQFASEGVYLFSTVAISNKAIAIQYLYQ